MQIRIKYALLLVLTSIIWGLAFVAQSAGMEHVGPFTFNGIRCIIGALVLAPVALIWDKKDGVLTPWFNKELLIGGLVNGVLLFIATNAQQIGIITVPAGKAGFLTALYIVLVPIFSLFMKKKPSHFIWISVALALVGMYFLCITDSFIPQVGDIYIFVCAIFFALQILAVDKFAPHVDVIKLSCYQFLVCGLLSLIPMIMEKPSMSMVLDCWLPILYAGVLSSGVAYTLQMEGQKRVPATVASLIMCLESVFSVIFGFLILHERLSVRELIGCGIMLVAVVLAQLFPDKSKDEEKVVDR